MAVFAEPFIKISSLVPMDRLSKWDAVFLSISAALSVGFLTFFLAGFFAYLQLEIQIDRQLSEAATQIQRNVDNDLEKLLGLLDTLSTKVMPINSVPNILERSNSADNWSECQDATTGTAESGQNPDRLSLPTEFEAGAYFERIVWVDSGGKQQVKCTIYDTNTPKIPVV